MNKLARLLRLDFLPLSTDLGLLILRIWFGGAMVVLHGWSKLTGFQALAPKFPDPLHVGSQISLGLTVFAEVVCAMFIVLGLFTRFAAVSLVITMAVGFAVVHQMALSGPASGELAFVYLGAYLVLFFTGPGRFSLDAALGGRRA
jgi:putative oxidoreductase